MLTADYTMLSVEDIAKALNISKAAVYKTVKKNKDLQKPIVKQDGRTFISEEGVDYLQNYYDKNIPEALYEILLKENFEKQYEDVIDKENIIELDNIIKFKEVEDNNVPNEVVYEPYDVEKVVDEISNSYKDKIINQNEHKKTPLDNISEEFNETIKVESDDTACDFSKVTDGLSSTTPEETSIDDINNSNKGVAINSEMIGMLKSYVEFLQTECDNKNKQLDNKDNIIKNMQSLLEKEQNTINAQMNVEERCREIDNKLFDLRNQLNERNEKKNKGLFRKIINLFK